MAAVERQEDLDVVLTVTLWGRRACQVHRCHQGAELRTPPESQGKNNRKQLWARAWLAELKQGLHWDSASFQIGYCSFSEVKGNLEKGIPPFGVP